MPSKPPSPCTWKGYPPCVALVVGGGRCPAHAVAAWSGSDRRQRLPRNWPQIRKRVLRRDGYRCQVPGCARKATDVDHVRQGDDHSEANLQSLCGPHHRSKTGREGNAARRSARPRRGGGVAP